MRLIECVPNFSEGRRTEVIDAIAAAITSVDVYLLDYSADPDHNRCVFTFAGEPTSVAQAMFRGAEVAINQIDLTAHVGVHPRIGVVDVVPFVPLRNVTMTECVELARAFGAQAAQAFKIPVYAYGYAALRPERENLAYIRRGGLEYLRAMIASDPDKMPDWGPPVIGKAGAMVVGARGPLIAYNVFLSTDDVAIAKAIASNIRESGGGLKYVRALGLLVRGRAQVSMNIIDYRQTPLDLILQTLEDEARKYGVELAEGELIGLIPQAALNGAAISLLRLPETSRDPILETRIGAATGDYREILFQ